MNWKNKSKQGIAALLLILAFVILTGCSTGGSGNAGSTAESSAPKPSSTSTAQVVQKGGSLTIPVSEVSEKAKFYPVKVDGTSMEILAVKAPDGTIRTAFNTCEVCYDSGRGYYKQSGDVLVCQNCGNQFQTSQVEVQSRGCNPWPIFDSDKTVTEDSISISYDFLSSSKEAFANWKKSY